MESGVLLGLVSGARVDAAAQRDFSFRTNVRNATLR
jgi:hypothetical protein